MQEDYHGHMVNHSSLEKERGHGVAYRDPILNPLVKGAGAARLPLPAYYPSRPLAASLTGSETRSR